MSGMWKLSKKHNHCLFLFYVKKFTDSFAKNVKGGSTEWKKCSLYQITICEKGWIWYSDLCLANCSILSQLIDSALLKTFSRYLDKLGQTVLSKMILGLNLSRSRSYKRNVLTKAHHTTLFFIYMYILIYM